jgi:hypothetical protein
MINSHMGHFLWNNIEDSHKYHLANWQLAALKKEVGGIGSPNMRSINLALSSAWNFRYQLHSNAWTRIVDFKYKTKNPNVLCCPNVGVSAFGMGCFGLCKEPILASSGLWELGRK